MNKLLSVIIPVYNVESTILKSVDSVRQQTYQSLEILLIDDGATDASGQLCDVLAQRDTRIRVFHKANGGVCSARNVGLQHARGEYITFFDPDDILLLDTYERMLTQQDADIIIGGFMRIVNGKKLWALKSSSALEMSAIEALDKMLRAQIFRGEIWDKIYTRKVLKNIQFDISVTYAEDLLFNYQVFPQAEKIKFVPIYGYQYYMNPHSVTINFSPKRLTYIDAIQKIRTLTPQDSPVYSLVQGKYAMALASSVLHMFLTEDAFYQSKITQYQNVLRKNLWGFILSEGLSARQRIGILYTVFPMRICRVLAKLARRFQHNL